MGQPARFYSSATHCVEYIFKSWLAIQKRLQQQLDGKQAWLEMLQSDEEICQQCGVELEVIRDRAAGILAKFAPTSGSTPDQAKSSQTGKIPKKQANQSEQRMKTWFGSETLKVAFACTSTDFVSIPSRYIATSASFTGFSDF